MRSPVWVGVPVVLLLAAVCLPARAVVLSYAPEVGSSFVNACTMYMEQETSVPGEAPTKRQAVGHMTLSSTVVEKTATGVREEGALRDTSLRTTGAGLPAGGRTETRPDVTYTLTTDPRGVVLEHRISGGGTWGDSLSGGLSALAGTGSFPASEVKPGDSWTGQYTIALGDPLPAMTVSAKCQLLELTTYRGRPCAKIRSVFSSPPQVTTAVAATGRLEGTALTYYDYVHSVVVESVSDSLISLIAPPAGKPTKGAAPAQVKLTLRSIAVLQETPPALPAP